MTEQSNNALLHYLERIAVALEEINEKLDELVSYEERINWRTISPCEKIGTRTKAMMTK